MHIRSGSEMSPRLELRDLERWSSSWSASTHHGVQQGRQCAGHPANTRHGAYLEYTQNIVIQHQGENPTGKPATPYLQHQPYSNVSSGTPKRGITSRLTGAGSLLPPVYSEAWAKGNAEVSIGHQSPPNGRSVGKGSPEHHFPPYGTPHTANIRVGKPTVLIEHK
ncbi:hypothetical protein TNCV_1244331 [Trichonephila clavipes]|nr:hypothetical protein TNCV_1244331 [Trichonephila clavipes]